MPHLLLMILWLVLLLLFLSYSQSTEPNLANVFEAFCDLGINLSDLAEFT